MRIDDEHKEYCIRAAREILSMRDFIRESQERVAVRCRKCKSFYDQGNVADPCYGCVDGSFFDPRER